MSDCYEEALRARERHRQAGKPMSIPHPGNIETVEITLPDPLPEVERVARVLAGDEADMMVYEGNPIYVWGPRNSYYVPSGTPFPLWHVFVATAERVLAEISQPPQNA